jgi:hypothetical protein
MAEKKSLEFLDADNIEFNPTMLDDESSSDDNENVESDESNNIDESHINNDNKSSTDNEASIDNEETPHEPAIEPNEMSLDEPGFFYNLLHILDDIYVYGRTVIENNYFNLSDNVDFNLVYPNIYIGNYSTSTNLELLSGLGITHIITVLPTFNPPFQDKFKYLHIPAYDDESQKLEPFFQQTNQFINDALTQHGKILIHCMVGRSRSVSVLIAFLIHIIKGQFNQSLVDTTDGNDVSNEIEYNKFIGNSNGKASRVITDGVASVRYIHSSQTTDTMNMNASMNSNAGDEISRLEYISPEFGNKYRKFMNYKKDIMIDEINKLIRQYNRHSIGDMEMQNTRADMYSDILAYVKKYRPIACPNEYFEQQLRMLLH